MNELVILNYSVLRLLIGFANAALMAWKLTTDIVIKNEPNPASTNIHTDIDVWYW